MLTGIVTVGLVALIWVMLRWKHGTWLALVPFALIVLPQFRTEWATYWHGFMHISIVYEIFERGLPPENPLMVGEPLRYMYGHHLLIAGLMRLLPISPPLAFALTNALGLGLLAVLVDRMARLISADRVFRAFAVFTAFMGASPLAGGPLNALAEAGPLPELEWRYIPLTKFVGINNNQVGYVLFATVLLGVCRLAAGRSGPASYALVAVGVVLGGFVYPPSWLGAGACAGVAALYFIARGGERRAAGLRLLAVLAGAGAVTAPFVMSLTAGKPPDAAVRVLPSLSLLRNHLWNLAAFALAPVTLLWMGRATLSEHWARHAAVLMALGLSAVVSSAMYFVMAIPTGAEYKMLGHAVLALSLPVGLALSALHRKHALAAVGIAAVLLLPSAPDFARAFTRDSVSDVVVSEGRMLRHRDDAQDQLYQWIARETRAEATFLDTYLTIPALARRQLLVGLDTRREAGVFEEHEHDGWLIPADRFLTVNTGVDPVRLAKLRSLADRILSLAPAAPSGRADLEPLAYYTEGRPLYVVARAEDVRARLSAEPDLVPVFENVAATVFRYAGSQSTSPPGRRPE